MPQTFLIDSIETTDERPDVTDILKPDYARNMRLIGHSDQGGRRDGIQVMVENGFAYIGHLFSQGFSIVDVRDPKNPKPAGFGFLGSRTSTMEKPWLNRWPT